MHPYLAVFGNSCAALDRRSSFVPYVVQLCHQSALGLLVPSHIQRYLQPFWVCRLFSSFRRPCRLSPPPPEVFKYVQVVTAICDALVHGANDITAAMGPFEIIYVIYVDGGVLSLGRPVGDGLGYL